MYHLFFPADSLRPYIECYWMARAPAGQPISLQENVFVDGKADILFNFGVAYQRKRLDVSQFTEALPLSNMDAQRLYPVAIQQQGQVDLISVRFRPGGIAAFLPMPAHELTDLTLNLADGLGEEGRELESRLFDCRANPAQQIALLDAFFLSRLQDSSASVLPRYLASRIEVSGGVLSIEALSDEVGYSIRSVDRFFRSVYGFSPKFYARVVRFQNALRLIIQSPDRPLFQIAHSCGYYDQSHFNKDFADFTGDTPDHYRLLLLEKAATPPPNLSTFYK